MGYLKWTLIIVFWVFAGGFFHYTLPQYDVVRVVGTYEQRIDFGENSWFWAQPDSGNAVNATNRDVLFIQTVRRNGRPMVYRNEDTGWGWPPYFKIDAGNLQTEAADLQSTQAEPRWAVIRHYGWRNEFLSIFPNAVGIRAVDGPDVRVIPWLSIAVLLVLGLVFWAIWVRWRRFRVRRIDPVIEDMTDSFEAAGDSLVARRGRFRRWLDTWKSN